MNEEQKEIIRYLLTKKITIFCYNYTKKYHISDIHLVYDDSKKMHYYLYEGKKMYFPKGKTDLEIKKYIQTLLVEQDEDSPHRYLSPHFIVSSGDIVFDIGAAEGIFSLSIIEKVSEIIIFEPEDVWFDALKSTFEPWKEKVRIIKKFISDIDGEHSITLDTFCKVIPRIDFIKADVEGFELNLLKGAVKVIHNHPNLKIAICTYHKHHDEMVLKHFLEENGFSCHYSNGYIINILDKNLKKPYLRRAVIRADNSQMHLK
ncbi:MAG: FkbM family methyltransferase [Tannerella sp.]|jgi:hypothetical protein|nr:FkbM family methyltransferase [Tannerella sp.]